MNNFPLSAVVCAAGAGSRMGHNKALCRIDQFTFLSSIVDTLHKVNVHSIVVVVGSQAQDVMQMHQSLDVIWAENPAWQTTFMLESLVCGLQHVPADHAVLHWPVDCVDVKPSDLNTLIHCDEAPLATLAFAGQPGHPMRISAPAANRLRHDHTRYNSLRDFVKEFGLHVVNAEFDALMNCNTQEKLQDYVYKTRIMPQKKL